MNPLETSNHPSSQRNWRTIVAMLMLALFSPLAYAQTISPQDPEQYFAELQERLALTDEQVAEMRPIVENSRQRQRDVLAGYGIDMESDEAPRIGRRDAMSIRKEMKSIRADLLDQLESVLTESQYEAFAEMQEQQADERRAAMRERFRSQR